MTGKGRKKTPAKTRRGSGDRGPVSDPPEVRARVRGSRRRRSKSRGARRSASSSCPRSSPSRGSKSGRWSSSVRGSRAPMRWKRSPTGDARPTKTSHPARPARGDRPRADRSRARGADSISHARSRRGRPGRVDARRRSRGEDRSNTRRRRATVLLDDALARGTAPRGRPRGRPRRPQDGDCLARAGLGRDRTNQPVPRTSEAARKLGMRSAGRSSSRPTCRRRGAREVRLRTLRAHADAVDARSLVAGPADGAGVVRGEERADENGPTLTFVTALPTSATPPATRGPSASVPSTSSDPATGHGPTRRRSSGKRITASVGAWIPSRSGRSSTRHAGCVHRFPRMVVLVARRVFWWHGAGRSVGGPLVERSGSSSMAQQGNHSDGASSKSLGFGVLGAPPLSDPSRHGLPA